MRTFLSLAGKAMTGLGLLLAASTAAPGVAADARPSAGGRGIGTAAPASEVSRDGVSQIPAGGPPIRLETGKGTLLRLSRAAATVFVANPEVADVQPKSPTMIYVIARTPGETVLYALDSEERVMLNAPVQVEHNLSRVRESLGAVAPGENLTVSSVDNSLVLSGKVSSAGRAERVRSVAAALAGQTRGTVVNRLAVATPNQVNIRVRIAEVNRTVLKSLGVNWDKLAGSHIGFNTSNPTTVGGNLPTSLGIIFGGASWLTQATIDALAQEGLVTLLAEPNLTATNGQPASFLAGGEFPVPIASNVANGLQTVTVEFKKFGVSLDVTPTIIDPDRLSLRVRSEVSQLSNNGAVVLNNITISALSVRRAETTVELGSGQSYVLAGLLQNTDTQNVSKVPGLGDIPILGQLFRSQQFQRSESELVIIATPYLVQPAPSAAALASPTDGLIPPHDAQRVIHGSLYRQGLPAAAKGPAGRAVHDPAGPAGFRLD